MLVCQSQLAQAGGLGRVVGQVVDQTGGVLPGVTIELVTGSQTRTAVTDRSGQYLFEAVPAGRAVLTCRLTNFSIATHVVDVGAGASVTADVVMTLALNADVVVTGSQTFRSIADVA